MASRERVFSLPTFLFTAGFQSRINNVPFKPSLETQGQLVGRGKRDNAGKK